MGTFISDRYAKIVHSKEWFLLRLKARCIVTAVILAGSKATSIAGVASKPLDNAIRHGIGVIGRLRGHYCGVKYWGFQ